MSKYDLEKHIKDDSYIAECLESLTYTTYPIYMEFKSKLIKFAVLTNTLKVFKYDWYTGKFEPTDLPYNQEEQYVLFHLDEIDEEGVPDFTYNFSVDDLPFFKEIKYRFLEKYVYRKKHKIEMERFLNEIKKPDEGTE